MDKDKIKNDINYFNQKNNDTILKIVLKNNKNNKMSEKKVSNKYYEIIIDEQLETLFIHPINKNSNKLSKIIPIRFIHETNIFETNNI